MFQAECPFNWAKVRAYIEGAVFPYIEKGFHDPLRREHACTMVIHDVQEMILVRNWLQSEITSPYEKRGVFVVEPKETHGFITTCVGICFDFENHYDFGYFRMAGFYSEPIIMG